MVDLLRYWLGVSLFAVEMGLLAAALGPNGLVEVGLLLAGGILCERIAGTTGQR